MALNAQQKSYAQHCPQERKKHYKDLLAMRHNRCKMHVECTANLQQTTQ